MVIRKANFEDCSQIAMIYNVYLGNATMDLEKRDAEYYQKFLTNADAREALYVLETDNGIVAMGTIRKYSYKKGYQFACETSVFVQSDQRGKGYGKKLKVHIIEECKKMRYNHLCAKIFASNKVSIDYNLKLGYTIVGVQQNIGQINGKWQDVVVMQYLIDDSQ